MDPPTGLEKFIFPDSKIFIKMLYWPQSSAWMQYSDGSKVQIFFFLLYSFNSGYNPSLGWLFLFFTLSVQRSSPHSSPPPPDPSSINPPDSSTTPKPSQNLPSSFSNDDFVNFPETPQTRGSSEPINPSFASSELS